MNRAKRFLEQKFGTDRFNGNGIARLLEEYRDWEDDTAHDSLISYCKLRGYTDRSNKQFNVDNRTWAFVYLYVYCNSSVNFIAENFFKTHGSVSTKIRDFEYLITDKDFLNNTEKIREEFKMDTKYCLEFIEANRRRQA